ncbi:MAG TPA: N-acetyl-gamma-glutamyl-phosphate reductase [Gemmatimonadales bacterium]|nr:N-acetyl-gamma-glutamyl-phosphate reductase [Gemmatimonadales bacterium]
MRVAVVGAAGYVGGELLRLLLQHPEVTDCLALSRSRAGRPIGETHPHLLPLTDACFADLPPLEAARGREVLFLALEHGESSRIVPGLIDETRALLVDLAADFRLADPELYARHYGAPPVPALLGRFTYALADVLGERLRGARALAVPGCFATAAQLALYPLAALPLAAPPALFGVTGSSGSGAQPKPTAHHPFRANNFFAYQVLGHRHEGEILQSWRAWTGPAADPPRLMTHSGPFVRGIHLTLHARLAQAAGDVAELYRTAYLGRPFVRILDRPPELTHAVGTNYALVHAAAAQDGREIQVMAAIDNLVKGAAGQAVQAMNLALGLPETAGLRMAGAFPC